MFVLFLGLLLVTLEKKPKSLVKRINNAFRMFAISEFVDEYEPSKYAKDLYNENADVNNLSVKIQLVKECVMSVLDFIKLDDATIQKVALAKVSNLMDAMDIFVAIAKGTKQPSILSDLQKAFPDITSADTWKSKLAVADNVKDAVDFIKDTIHADSVVNLSKRKQVHDEISESNSEEQFEDSELDELEEADNESENNEEKEELKDEKEEKLPEKKSYRRKYGNFYEIPSPARKNYIENEDSEDNKSNMLTEEIKKPSEISQEKEVSKDNEDEEDDEKENQRVESINKKQVQEVPQIPLPARKRSKLAHRTSNTAELPTRNNPRFLSSEQIKKLNKEKHDKKNSRKEAKNTPFEVPNPVTPEPFKHHAPIEKIESQTIPDDTDEDGEVQANPTENKKLEAAVENEIPKIAVHGPLVHRKGSKQFRKVNTETDENQNENDMEEDNFEEDSDNNEAESDEVEDNE